MEARRMLFDEFHSRVVDELGPVAARQNKANAVVRQASGVLVGHWVESPREQYELWRGEG